MTSPTSNDGETARTALGALSLMDVEKALREGCRVSIMIGRSDLKRDDKEVAWIGVALAEVCRDFRIDVAVGDMPGLVDVSLEIVRRVRRIKIEGIPYGVAANVDALGRKSPYRGVCLNGEALSKDALTVATDEMRSIIWNQNVWTVLIQLADQKTVMGFLAGHDVLPHDEDGGPISVDAAVAFLRQDGGTRCGYIRSLKDDAYGVLAWKIEMCRTDEDTIPLLLEEARERKDAETIAHVASWFEDVKDDKKRYLELTMEAAKLGSPEANFWLGHEYRSGENLQRNYEKAYECFIKGKDVDWVPIDPEENFEFEIDGAVDVTSEGLLRHGDIDWWLFVLEKHPTRALKCGIADWYMKQGGDENRDKARRLLEELASASRG